MSAPLTSFFMDLSIGSIVPLCVDSNGEEKKSQFYEDLSFVHPPGSDAILNSSETEEFLFEQLSDSQDFLFEVLTEEDLQSPDIGEISCEQLPGIAEASCEQSAPGSDAILHSPETEEFWYDHLPNLEEFFLDVLTEDELADLQSPGIDEISCEPAPYIEEILSEQLPGNAEASCEQLSGIAETSSAESVIRTDKRTRSTISLGCQSNNVITESDETGKFQDYQVSDRPNNNPPITASVKAIIKGSCDNTNMFVRTTSDKQVKKLCCPFCSKLFIKLARHLAAMHKKEPDVKKFVNLPKGSKERRLIQDALRKTGLFMWNTNSDLNKNELIPSRRPKQDLNKEATGYTTCPYCYGPYTKTNLRHHAAACHKNPVKNERILKTLAKAAEGRVHENASMRLAEVISIMREDIIVRLIRYDWLLIVFGNKMCCKYTPHYQENMIRARLRLSGRVLYEIKKIDSKVTDFASIYHVEQYNSLVAAIKVIGRFDPTTNEFAAPAMASCAVTFIKHIGKYLSAEYIRLRDRVNKIETEDFLTYMDTDIGVSILRLVGETQSKMRRGKVQNIPTMDDVKKLIRYINIERNSCFEQLSANYSYKNWLKLAELCMTWMIVFNRRRTGEVRYILVREFLGRQSIDDASNEQMLSKLSEDAKVVARKFKRMKIRGKKGRTVPVLLKPSVDKAITLLMSYRELTGISTGSPFLFQLASSHTNRVKTVDACQTLRKLSVLCGATNASSLRGTNLRKHMATTCVSLELNDALVSEVADFMGHAEKIHREYYRQNTIDREVVQMAQLLETAAGKCDSDDDDNDDDDDDADNDTAYFKEVRSFVDGSIVSACKEIIDEAVVVDNDEDHKIMEDLQFSLPHKCKDVTDVFGNQLKTKFTKKRWSQDEIKCVREVFSAHFKKRTLPTPLEISNQQKKHPELRERTWQQIKTWINNQQKKR